MLPRKIHYIWFGNNPLTPLAEKCISSWKEHCPDYEIVRWDESNFDIAQNRYCREAYEAKKWAFVSDYARLWILVNHGGIYMDTDVEVLRPLDGFLGQEAFSGFETDTDIPTGIMACEKGFPLFAELLHDYDNRSFVLSNGLLDTTTNVTAITNACLAHGFVPNNKYQVVDGFALYPKEWFCPKSYKTGLIDLSENTHTIHHFSGSWLDESDREIRGYEQKIAERCHGVNSKLAAAIAKAVYGFKHGDFQPFFDGVKKNLSNQGRAK